MVVASRAQTVARRLRAEQARVAQQLAAQLRAHWRQVAARVVRRFLANSKRAPVLVEHKAAGFDELLPALAEQPSLELVILPYVEEMLRLAAGNAAAVAGSPPLIGRDPRLEALLRQAGTRIRQIDALTLDAVRETLRLGAERLYSPSQVANGVPQDGFRGLRAVIEETYRNRAETIARTELAWAAQTAAHDRYGEAGVTQVDISDGPGCGWRYHGDPDQANGSRRSLAEARRYPTAHPNCGRVSLPVLESRRR